MNRNSTTDDNGQVERSFDWPPGDFSSTEEFIDAASEYFATDFPNPERRGCPAPGAIDSLVDSGQIPAAELRAHLFECSNCLGEYREALATRRQRIASSASWWRNWGNAAAFAFSRVPGVAYAAIVLLAGGVLFWALRRDQISDISISRPQPVVLGDAAQATSSPNTTRADSSLSEVRPRPIPEGLKPERKRVKTRELPIVEIDLNDYSMSEDSRRRESGIGGEEAIKLPQAQIRFDIRLPSPSQPGRPRIAVVDGYLRAIASGKSLRQVGDRLSGTLDLRHLNQGQYRLRLSYGEGLPEFYQMRITTR